MTGPRPKRQPRLGGPARAFVRTLLHICPADLRGEFGEQWLAFIEIQRGEDRYGARASGSLRYWKDVAIDVVKTAWRARFEPGGGRDPEREPGGVKHLGWAEELWQDLRYGARALAKSRAFTAVAILSLALGIGVNTAVFSVVDAMMFRPLPFEHSDRLVVVYRTTPRRPGSRQQIWVGQYRALQQETAVFEEVASFSFGGRIVAASEGHATEMLRGHFVSANLFAFLGSDPILGRHFLPEEEQLGSEPVTILSHGLWQQRFGADANVIGETLRLDGYAATIVGVMPPGFDYLQQPRTQLWLPTRFTPADDRRVVVASARLAAGVSLEQARRRWDPSPSAPTFSLRTSVGALRLPRFHGHQVKPHYVVAVVLWELVENAERSPSGGGNREAISTVASVSTAMVGRSAAAHQVLSNSAGLV